MSTLALHDTTTYNFYPPSTAQINAVAGRTNSSWPRITPHWHIQTYIDFDCTKNILPCFFILFKFVLIWFGYFFNLKKSLTSSHRTWAIQFSIYWDLRKTYLFLTFHRMPNLFETVMFNLGINTYKQEYQSI